jgi:polar amino acid transport system substrate-binding protein
MKKNRLLSLFVLDCLVLAACAGRGAQATPEAALLTDLGGRTVTVAVENAYPPFNFIDEATGSPAGWDYDAVAEICRRLNCVPQFRQAAWEGIFTAMAAGEFDVLADGVTRLYERELTVEFSIPYVTTAQVLLIRSDYEIPDVEAFKANPNVVVGVMTGFPTSEIAALENFPRDRVQSLEDFCGALMAGDVDAVVIDSISPTSCINANPGMVRIGPQLTSNEQLAFAFPPGSPLLLPFNAALRAMQADGTLQRINDTWLNPQ